MMERVKWLFYADLPVGHVPIGSHTKAHIVVKILELE